MTATGHLPAPPERVYSFHADVRNLLRLMPGPVRIVSARTPSAEGDLQVLRLGVPPLSIDWHARIAVAAPPSRVVDVQERGPFRFWRHTHAIAPARGGSLLVDAVEFRLAPGPFGRLMDRLLVAPVLRLLFAERHRRTRRLLGRGEARR